MIAFRKRFPQLHEILALYATIVFLIYSWAIITFFWKVPSWLYFLSSGEILVILAYTLASSLLESTVILISFLLVGLILPSSWLFRKFVVRGSIIIHILTFWVIIITLNSMIEIPPSSDLLYFGILFLLMVSLALVLADRMPLVSKLLIALGNRLTIVLYLWLPLSLLGLLVIILRIL